MAAQETAGAEPGHEAEILALAPFGDRELRAAGDLAHLALAARAERERQPLEQLRAQAREHVHLILAAVARAPQKHPLAVILDARVVTGQELRRTEGFRGGEQCVEAHLPVAHDARVGSATGVVLAQERLDHTSAEALA
ncbi:hypothetical protein HRbin41_01112 [bacterium HR41]|nr:hypothetical protein HRbin41_01112 [bacterium HR41]